MVRFTLPSYLFDLLPEDERLGKCSLRSVSLHPGSWTELAQEIQKRFPPLAEHILEETGSIATGFVLVVNDEVIQSDYQVLDFRCGDEIIIIASIAGG